MEKSTIGERIRHISKEYYSNMTEFANDLKISQSMVSKICTGKALPSDRTVADICRICNINETWLRNGTGEMVNNVSRYHEISKIVYSKMGDESEFASQLITLIAETPPTLLPALADAFSKLVDVIEKNPGVTYDKLIQSAYEEGFQFGFKMAQKLNSSQDTEV